MNVQSKTKRMLFTKFNKVELVRLLHFLLGLPNVSYSSYNCSMYQNLFHEIMSQVTLNRSYLLSRA